MGARHHRACRARPQGGEPVADLQVRRSQLRGIAVPESLVPLAIDELPVLFIAAAAAQGETVFTGAAELRVKESDRLAVMAEGLTRLGVPNELAPDGIRIQGGAGGDDGCGRRDRQPRRSPHRHGLHRGRACSPMRRSACATPRTSAHRSRASWPRPGPAGCRSRKNEPAPSSPSMVHLLRSAVVTPIVTIDGPSGSGKGTISRRVASRLGWHLLDSGALYRLVALAGAREGLDPTDEARPCRAGAPDAGAVRRRTPGGGAGAAGRASGGCHRAIRTEEAGQGASRVAAWPQRPGGPAGAPARLRPPPGLVADGRDMGTVVFPGAS